MTIHSGDNDQYEEQKMTDPHEDLVEAVARKMAVDNLYPYPAHLDEARSIVALIAERTKDATPEMEATPAIMQTHFAAAEMWPQMHRASALWPKEPPR